MHEVVVLLERKRTLLDRREEANSEQLATIEHDLQEIDRILSRLESEERLRQRRPSSWLRSAGTRPANDAASTTG
jgi:hypothetical protein